MPHFIVDCSNDLLATHGEAAIAEHLHRTVNASGLFDEADIKVRVNPYADYRVGGTRQPFVHVFSHIMEGRSVEQRAALSRAIVEALSALFPDLPRIAANIYEFERATYCNRAML